MPSRRIPANREYTAFEIRRNLRPTALGNRKSKYHGQSCCGLFTVAVWLTQGRGQSFEEGKYEEAIARCPVGDHHCGWCPGARRTRNSVASELECGRGLCKHVRRGRSAGRVPIGVERIAAEFNSVCRTRDSCGTSRSFRCCCSRSEVRLWQPR